MGVRDLSNEINGSILTSKDISKCRQNLKGIIIAPFDSQKCKGIGYNLSPTEFCYSVRKKRLLSVHKSDKEIYVWIPPHDTVLTLSNEYLKVSEELAGCFLSRLRPVTRGMGNISTTLDPGWKGMLLLPLSNPSSKKIKLVIKTRNSDKMEPVAIVTMLLWRTGFSPAQNQSGETFSFKLDNPPMRTDIWKDLASGPPRIRYAKWNRLFRTIIDEMTDYELPADAEGYIVQLKRLLLSLEKAANHSPLPANIIKDDLISLYHVLNEREMPKEIVEKIQQIYQSDVEVKPHLDSFDDYCDCLQLVIDDLENDASGEKRRAFLDKIQALRNECMYQELCEQVSGIHNIIERRINRRWNKGGVARLWLYHIKPHFAGILATVILLAIFFSGLITPSTDFLLKVMIGLVPVLTTILFDRLSQGKD